MDKELRCEIRNCNSDNQGKLLKEKSYHKDVV